MMVLLLSCDNVRESKNRMFLSGPKRIAHYMWKKQDANGDFSIVIHDTTNLATMLLWDNDDVVINNVSYDGNGIAPAGWKYANVGVGYPTPLPIGWYADWEEMQTLTFWSEDKTLQKYRVTYVMSTNANASKITLQTVYHTVDGVFQEVLELESMSGND